MRWLVLCGFVMIFSLLNGQTIQSIDAANKRFWTIYQSDLSKAHELCNQTIQDARKINYLAGLGTAQYQKGVAFDIEMKADSARVYLLKGIKTLEQTSDVAALASAHNNLGIHYYYQYNYNKAIEEYQKANRFFQKAKMVDDMAGAYNNIGLCYKNTQKYNQALTAYNQALSIARTQKDKEVQASTLLNIVAVYFEKGANNMAKQKLEEILPLIKTNEQLQINYAFTLGEIELKTQHYTAAEIAFLDGLAISRKTKNKEREQYFYDALARLYKAWKKYDLAFDYMQRYDSLRDVSYSEQTNQFLAEYEQKFQLKEKEELLAKKEVKLLRTQASKRKLKEQFQEKARFLSAAIIVIVVLLLVTFLTLWAYRLKKRSEALSKVILEEKSVLAKEMHHRVKNNLQIVASMIALQSRTMDEQDQEKLDAVIASIQSMAKIHETLYEGSTWEWVQVDELFQTLSSQLPLADGKPIQVSHEANHLKIDLDTAIALGLIINELFTNAIKYAFKEQEQPQIQLSLSFISNTLVLVFQDNGLGFGANDSQGTQFGGRMIQSMLKKIKGEIVQTSNNGARIEIRILRFKTNS